MGERRYNRETKDHFDKLILEAEDETSSAVAQRLGISYPVVVKVRRAHGIDVSRKKRPKIILPKDKFARSLIRLANAQITELRRRATIENEVLVQRHKTTSVIIYANGIADNWPDMVKWIWGNTVEQDVLGMSDLETRRAIDYEKQKITRAVKGHIVIFTKGEIADQFIEAWAAKGNYELHTYRGGSLHKRAGRCDLPARTAA